TSPWYAELRAKGPRNLWPAWRVTRSREPAWWKGALEVAGRFAIEHDLLDVYRSRFAGIPLNDLTTDRANREFRMSTSPIWEIANELIVARYLERVLRWRYTAHEPPGDKDRRGDWQFETPSGRPVFVEVKSVQEVESWPDGVYMVSPNYERI